MKLTRVKYTAARTGNPFILLEGIGLVAKGATIWVPSETVALYVQPLPGASGADVSDFSVVTEWASKEGADDSKAEDRLASNADAIKAAISSWAEIHGEDVFGPGYSARNPSATIEDTNPTAPKSSDPAPQDEAVADAQMAETGKAEGGN